MKNKIKVVVNGKKTVTLNERDYLAQGGEGAIYVKNGLAFKIYLDPARVIHEQKIMELREIDSPYVITPRDILQDPKTGLNVGYTMPYVADVEYLCRLFVGNFKKARNITPPDIVELVKRMQTTLRHIHSKNIIAADYNEMNILVDSSFSIPYHIDVDSYQTPHFKATAIMESIRDRQLPMGTFNELSDWFSWAVVTFQLYTGIHPYKGRHHRYKPGDLDRRMSDGVSVFDKEVNVPKHCRDLSAIPTPHLEWYKRVFGHNERSIPPLPDKVSIPCSIALPRDQYFGTPIRTQGFFGGHRFVLTGDAVYRDKQQLFNLENPKAPALLAEVEGGEAVIAVMDQGTVAFYDSTGKVFSRINAHAVMACNKNIYTLNDDYLVENRFLEMGKTKHLAKPLAPAPGLASRLFPGIAVIDLFGKKNLMIPSGPGKCIQVKVPELDNYRIVDAKREQQACRFTCEKDGQFRTIEINFDRWFSRYNTSPVA